MDRSKLHAVLVSSPGMGHLIPILTLGKHLASRHNFSVTIFVVSSHSSLHDEEVAASTFGPQLCDLVFLPPVDTSCLIDADATVGTQIAFMMRQSLPELRSAISAMKSPADVFIVDFLGTEALPIAEELEITRFVYVTSNAWALSLILYSPILDKEVQGQYVDLKEPLRIPGCNSVRPEEVVDPMLDRTNQQYFEYIRLGIEIPRFDGILVNTWEDLEGQTLAALREESLLGKIAKVPVFAVGPQVRPASSIGLRGEWCDWLDRQPDESVVYVCFGSGGTLSLEQTTELAYGLELSQQRFIWVSRTPTAASSDAAFFSSGNCPDDPLAYFPDGFLARTRNTGQVVSSWVSQIDILSHQSVGGFLTHCGWNSILESITNGVPMIAWPLYAEQKMNATLLAEEMGVAVRPELLPSKKVVGREEIAAMVKKIMVVKEGYNIRAKAKSLKHSAAKALQKGGSSSQAFNQVAGLWRLNVKN